jgi:hypothetical protein
MIYSTEEEKLQRAFIESKFDKVICPNRDVGELGSIEPYLKIIEKKCTHVVCSEFLELVGRGVWDEVRHARKLKLPIYCVRKVDNKYKLLKVKSGKVVDKDNWRNYAKLFCEEIV